MEGKINFVSEDERKGEPVSPPNWRPHPLEEEKEILERIHKNSLIKIDFEKQKLCKEELIDKMRGIIYGTACADALCLSTENMSKEGAEKLYGEVIRKRMIEFSDIVRTGHVLKCFSLFSFLQVN